MSTATIPFAARSAAPPCLVETSIMGVSWNEGLQITLQADGSPWHTGDLAASTTDTNHDGQGDDAQDLYYASAS